MELSVEPAARAASKPAHYARRKPLLLCLSHLRWDFVFQRPQHVLTRAAKHFEVIYVEEPTGADGVDAHWSIVIKGNVSVATPAIPAGLPENARTMVLQRLLDRLLAGRVPAVSWYYTPMALDFTRQVQADVTVYDNMDELSLFHGADSRMLQLEQELLARADVVFTGGQSLFEAKCSRHANIHAVPSSVDVAHFAAQIAEEPEDLAAIAHPRIGFFGVIDERMDMALLDSVAAVRPDLQFIMVGPTAKIDPADRPLCPNIHWLGAKRYEELPAICSTGTAASCPLPATTPPGSSAPRKRRNSSPPDCPWFPPPSGMWSTLMASGGWWRSAQPLPKFQPRSTRPWRRGGRGRWRDMVHQQLALSSWDRTWAFMHGRIVAMRSCCRGADPCMTG
jgi:hypothetical protein